MKFYRVERDGVGPYRADGPRPWQMSYAHSRGYWHPTPFEEPALVDVWCDGVHVCGFTDETQLGVWFMGWEHHLNYFGFELVVYEVSESEVFVGEHQSIAVHTAVLNAQVISRGPVGRLG